MTLPPKVQQVLDEMRSRAKDFRRYGSVIDDVELNEWADRLQSVLEEMQKDEQKIIDAATNRTLRTLENIPLSFTEVRIAKSVIGFIRKRIEALVGQPLPSEGPKKGY